MRNDARRPLAWVIAAAVAACGAGLLAGCASAGRTEHAASDELRELVERMSGSFSSSAQAAEDERFFDVRLHMVPIWPKAGDGRWLYVEQAMATAQDRPYRQRVYRVFETEPGVFVSEVYTLDDAEDWAGAWAHPRKFRHLERDDLVMRDGCSITLRRDAGGDFVGSTEGTGCASDLRGASYATSEVRVMAEGLDTLDRGFDASGNQVWGSTAGAYRFRRVAPE